ncbi:MAG: neutral/alkaline non-lysosomal ceramidase N-terminal domain-containing protein [Armatimonadetes bacterium]|nr:neutral/alkaline non-lysosomal ceramidase N-terminal domain-containing protein [Armatimonadota bacterium]
MSEQLMAGAFSVDITPPIGLAMAGYGGRDHASEGILEPLYAYAIALEQGDEACAMVVADLIGVKREVSDAVRARVAELSDLPPEKVLICTTHTHWGPVLQKTDYLPVHLNESVSQEYTAALALDLATAVVEAWNAREPAVALAGTGWADGTKFNRRPVGPDGKVAMSLAMELEQARVASAEGARMARTWVKGGGPGERLSEPLEILGGNRAGVSDPSLPVLKLVSSEDGAPIAALMAFGCHAVTGADRETTFYRYSPDWPGYTREVIEQMVGCPAAVMAGCCGDQVPLQRAGDWRERVGYSVGAEGLRVWESLIGDGIGPLRVGVSTARVPVRELPSVEEAQAALDAKDDPEGTGAVYEREILHLARAYGDKEFVEYEVWAMGLGDEFGLVGLPGEILDEIGLQIKQQSPFAHTAIIELALESPGYFCTDAAMDEGGYEPTWSFPGKGTEAALVQAGVEALKKARG